MIYLQELFLGGKNITYSAFNFYWPGRVTTEARVLTLVKNDLVDKIVMENRSNLADHSCFGHTGY